jgi:opacity protein-like surface antigen
MRISIIVTIAAALTTVAGTTMAQDAADTEPAPVVSRSSLRMVEFTPMTRSERFRHYLTGTFGPNSLATSVARAGLDQLRDSPSEWGQGSAAFGDRLGNAYAKHIIRRTLEFGGTSVLHQDDRYFRSGETGIWRRTKYAVASTFLARRDDGQRTLAYARIGSAAGAAFISRAWQPASTTDASHAASSFGFTVATDLGTNVFREFWPDLKRRVHRR